jgi:ABC-2 type transport system permease protein
MNRFLGIVSYEYRMSIRRWGVWLAFGICTLPVVIVMVASPADSTGLVSPLALWSSAGELAWSFNLFMPVVAGISVSDRLVRDRRLGVSELFDSTPLNTVTYILGKYTGAMLAALTPLCGFSLALSALIAIVGGLPGFIPAMLSAFLAINLPAFLFIGAFSLALPLVLPLRVYQVLFTGYWYWGNYLNPAAFPSISGTILNACGKYMLAAYFNPDFGGVIQATRPEAVLNVVVLLACGAAALTALYVYLQAGQRRA